MTASPNDRFREITSKYFDEALTVEEECELLDLLDDAGRRTTFVSMCRISGDLAGLAVIPEADDAMISRIMRDLAAFAPETDPPPVTSRSRPIGRRRISKKLLAAGAVAAVGLVAAILLFSSKQIRSGPVVASVIDVEGDAQLLSDSGLIPLAQGHSLAMGDGIVTGTGSSRVVVEYPDHTRVEIGPESSIAALVDAGQNRSGPPRKCVRVLRGVIAVDAAKQPTDRPMLLITPEAEVEVVGTRFSLESVENGTQVRVVEGSVRMLRRVDQQAIDVPQGSYAVATPEFDQFLARPIAANSLFTIKHLPVKRGAFLEHYGGIAALAFTLDGKRLATGSLQGAPVRLWDMSGSTPPVPTELNGHTAAVWSASFAIDGRLLATGGVDQSVRLESSDERSTIAVLPQKSHVRAVVFSPDGKWLATGAHDSVLRLRDPISGEERLACAENDHGGWSGLYSLAFSPDSKLVAIGLYDRRVRVRSVAHGREIFLLAGHTGEVTSVAFSPDGRWLASASSNEVIVWDAVTGSQVRTMIQAAPVTFSPDSRLLAVGGRNPGLVDVETGRTVALIDGHRGNVFSLAFQPGRNRLAIGGWRGVVLLDIPTFDDLCASSDLVPVSGPAAAAQVLTSKLHHLRAGNVREWADFPQEAEGPDLKLRFRGERNDGEWTLHLRQQDVKQTWKVLLNGKELDRLAIDENDMTLALPVPAGAIAEGENLLTIEQVGTTADDIRVGEISLSRRPVAKCLGEASVDIRVVDADRKDLALPCRITVLNSSGGLASVGTVWSGPYAVRPGVIYTANGKAKFSLRAGDYTIVAGRGFAYGIESARISVKAGETIRKTLSIRLEVPTKGWISCDTHVHTFTHSGHGDCALDERMVTLAGEGIELPIATDHNVQIDYQAAAVKQGVRRYFTPVIGNEVTTALGHFNVFPLPAKGPMPDWKSRDWKTIFDGIERIKGEKAIILNHPRDVHGDFRPFGPEHHLALTGENLDGWALRANAMELVNSGALQSDLMRPVRDWFGLLNRGQCLTPVGASDSHDVSRYIVGQGRTYIRCQADQPGEIDVAQALDHFLKGQVSVSCGLLTMIAVNGQYGSGDLAPGTDEVKVAVRVLGPSWVKADKVELYANGRKIKEATVPDSQQAGAKWETVWVLPRVAHDVHLVAVATGPAVTELHWPIARPYQPSSPVVKRQVIGITGAVWIDGDGDGKRTCALDYARRLFDKSPEAKELIASLAPYDEAVAQQAAGLLQQRQRLSASDPAVQEAAKKAGPHVERAFLQFAEAWRESQIARSQPKVR